jgi:hypothetical protein
VVHPRHLLRVEDARGGPDVRQVEDLHELVEGEG